MQALQEENEKLKKENEMLKERMDYLRAVQATHIDDINDTHAEYRDMVLKLKEEIKKLKETTVKLRTQKKKFKDISEKLTKEIDELKTPFIQNRDSRCDQFDIRVGEHYIMECLQGLLDEKEYELLQDPPTYFQRRTAVLKLVAESIDKAINSHIKSPTYEINTQIMEYISDTIQECRDLGMIMTN